MKPADPPRRQRRKEARPAELAAAALELFVEKGFAATRLDDVAARAGVSKGTLYLYFDSKDALFRAVIEESVLPLIAEVEARIEALKDDPARLLRELLVNWWQRVGSTPLGGTCKLMICEAGNFPEVAAYYNEAVIGRWNALLCGVIESGIARGVFRPASVEVLRQMAFYPILMRAVWRSSMTDCGLTQLEPDVYFDTYFDVLFRGMLAASAEEAQV